MMRKFVEEWRPCAAFWSPGRQCRNRGYVERGGSWYCGKHK